MTKEEKEEQDRLAAQNAAAEPEENTGESVLEGFLKKMRGEKSVQKLSEPIRIYQPVSPEVLKEIEAAGYKAEKTEEGNIVGVTISNVK